MSENLDRALPATEAPPTPQWRAVWAGAVGNFTEFFDWTIYGYMAPVFAALASQDSRLVIFLIVVVAAVISGITFYRMPETRDQRT